MTAAELFDEISALVGALRFEGMGSEGDEPLVAVRMPGTCASTAEALLAHTQTASLARQRDAIAVLDDLAAAHARRGDHAEEAAALASLMQRHLTDMLAAVVASGGWKLPVYVIGRTAEGELVGFSSSVIWT